jgi:hypothetical protein
LNATWTLPATLLEHTRGEHTRREQKPPGAAKAPGGERHEQPRLSTAGERYCKMVSQYVVFGPEGLGHPSVWANCRTPLKSFVVPG